MTPIRPQLAQVTPIHRHPTPYVPGENPTGLPIAAAALYNAAQEALADGHAIRDGKVGIAHDGMTREQSAQVYLQLGLELLRLAGEFG